MKQYLACFLTFVALSTPVSSATFSEPPDLATRTADAISVGSLDLGTNTASGALDGACADPGTDLQCNQTSALDGQDTILFTIDAGLQLASIEVSFDSGGSGPLGFVLSSSLLAADRSLLEFNEQTFGETKTLGTSGPWGAGEYFFNANGWFADEAGDWDASWTARFSVEEVPPAVPLPAGGLLLLTCLGGFTMLRRGS